jgi:hypothetical protein
MVLDSVSQKPSAKPRRQASAAADDFRSPKQLRDERVSCERARRSTRPTRQNDQFADRQNIDLLRIDWSDYDPGQLPCSHERGLWTLEAALRQIAVLSPQTLAQQP